MLIDGLDEQVDTIARALYAALPRCTGWLDYDEDTYGDVDCGGDRAATWSNGWTYDCNRVFCDECKRKQAATHLANDYEPEDWTELDYADAVRSAERLGLDNR